VGAGVAPLRSVRPPGRDRGAVRYGIFGLVARFAEGFALQLESGVLDVPITVEGIDLTQADEVVRHLPVPMTKALDLL